jgi:hypothetical protein
MFKFALLDLSLMILTDKITFYKRWVEQAKWE